MEVNGAFPGVDESRSKSRLDLYLDPGPKLNPQSTIEKDQMIGIVDKHDLYNGL